MSAAIGIVLQPLERQFDAWFGSAGAIVSDVIVGSPADRTGIAAGDVLLDIAGTPVTDVTTALALLQAAPVHQEVALRVRRNGREQSMPVFPVSALEMYAAQAPRSTEAPESSASASARLPRSGRLALQTIASAANLDVAGAGADAELIAVNQRPVTSVDDALRQLRRATGPALLYVEDRGERLYLVATSTSP
jgi:serine protease Do